MPILALIGICLLMFAKRGKQRDTGTVLLGFAVLMVGMGMMSDAVSGLKDSPEFCSVLTMFSNPVLGILAGLVLTTIVQSSSASIGILQSLTVTGAITYGAAIPIIMGQNIGTCVTAMISSVGANKNGKRAALIHLYFNIIGVVVWLSVFYAANGIFSFSFTEKTIGTFGIALVHTVFKLLSVILMAPFAKLLEKLAVLTIRDKDSVDNVNLLDERLLDTPAVAIERAREVACNMAQISCEAMKMSLSLLSSYDTKKAEAVRKHEEKADVFEDTLGTYLVKLASRSMTEADSREITKLLHIIGDFERISDHAVNIVESAEEITDKKISFSAEAQREVKVLSDAVDEILGLAYIAYTANDIKTASFVEPLEQTVDYLRDRIKSNHITRLQKSECTMEHGFVLSDILTNCERVSDHCSNIAGCIIEISQYDALNVHKYLGGIKSGGEEFTQKYNEYRRKYSL